VSSAAEDLNHEACDGSSFYLLPTQCSDQNLSEGLIDYYEKINRILNYGEFRHLEYEPMLRRGRKDNVSRSYDKYTQISSDNTVKVTNTINIFNAILCKIKNDKIVKDEQELMTKEFLLDQENDDSGVARIQDVPVTIPFSESAGDENKVIIPYQKGHNIPEMQDSSNKPE